MIQLTSEQISHFQEKGVVYLPGVFADWVEPLRQAVQMAMDDPSPLERSYQPKDGSAPFFQDYGNWKRFEPLRDFVFQSEAGRLAAELMRSRTARFFHDHILVKRPGTSLVTPWHQDLPYYCVQGAQSVSFWTPLDVVAREISLECVSGSHRWSEAGYRPKRFDGSNLYQDDHYSEMPNIDVHRNEFEILGYTLQPGDAIAFDFRTIHGAPGNQSITSRRVVSTRWVGDDARWAVREGVTSPPYPHLDLPDGAPFDAPDFPLVYPTDFKKERP
jgi:ectoine hydroxylase-related dioxygenase (phytanoyl-CoA dioxygenase family)